MLDFVYMRCQGTLLVVTIRLRKVLYFTYLLYSIAGGIWGWLGPVLVAYEYLDTLLPKYRGTVVVLE